MQVKKNPTGRKTDAKYKRPKNISPRYNEGRKTHMLSCRYRGESNELYIDGDVI